MDSRSCLSGKSCVFHDEELAGGGTLLAAAGGASRHEDVDICTFHAARILGIPEPQPDQTEVAAVDPFAAVNVDIPPSLDVAVVR